MERPEKKECDWVCSGFRYWQKTVYKREGDCLCGAESYNTCLKDMDEWIKSVPLEKVMVKDIAKQMKPSITFDDKAYEELLGIFAPKGIKSLAIAIRKLLLNEEATP